MVFGCESFGLRGYGGEAGEELLDGVDGGLAETSGEVDVDSIGFDKALLEVVEAGGCHCVEFFFRVDVGLGMVFSVDEAAELGDGAEEYLGMLDAESGEHGAPDVFERFGTESGFLNHGSDNGEDVGEAVAQHDGGEPGESGGGMGLEGGAGEVETVGDVSAAELPGPFAVEAGGHGGEDGRAESASGEEYGHLSDGLSSPEDSVESKAVAQALDALGG